MGCAAHGSDMNELVEKYNNYPELFVGTWFNTLNLSPA
jgi:hypothetical protein